MILARDYVFLNYVRVNCVGRNFSKYARGLWQVCGGCGKYAVCLTNFALFVNNFFYESGPTSYKMYCACMLYSWYGSVPVEYDARSSIT